MANAFLPLLAPSLQPETNFAWADGHWAIYSSLLVRIKLIYMWDY